MCTRSGSDRLTERGEPQPGGSYKGAFARNVAVAQQVQQLAELGIRRAFAGSAVAQYRGEAIVEVHVLSGALETDGAERFTFVFSTNA
ncbi:hypothetical protein GCM10011515_05830 [Tsuneonella deserti]|uniref:Uncharacterized protein n=1 Tax=Tsuneonella deserti TaxID=2035528 RepID=A0ABQ1S088_9SPHN|nr:hypothetical protein GCM10011515_05830 [Tsuneonella deserti]